MNGRVASGYLKEGTVILLRRHVTSNDLNEI